MSFSFSADNGCGSQMPNGYMLSLKLGSVTYIYRELSRTYWPDSCVLVVEREMCSAHLGLSAYDVLLLKEGGGGQASNTFLDLSMK